MELKLETKAVQQSVSLPLGTIYTLKKIARDYHLSVSSIIREALGKYLGDNYPEYVK